MDAKDTVVFPEIILPDDMDFSTSPDDNKNLNDDPFEDLSFTNDNLIDDESEEIVQKPKVTLEESSTPKKEVKLEGKIEETTIPEEDITKLPQNKAFQTHIQTLQELGFLTLPEGYELDPNGENLEEAYRLSEQYRQQLAVEDIVLSMPEKLRDIVIYGMNGGTDLNQFFEVKQYEDNLSYDLDTREGQVEVLKTYLKSKGNDETYIDAIIDRLEDTGRLETEARNRSEELKTEINQRKQQMIENERRQLEEQQANAQRYQQEVIQAIKKESWTNKGKQDIYQMLYGANQQGENEFQAMMQNVRGNPLHLVQLARIVKEYYDPEKGFGELNKRTAQAQSGLKEKVMRSLQDNAIPFGGGDRNNTRDTKIDWDDVDVPLDY